MMGIKRHKYPLIQSTILMILLSFSQLAFQTAQAEVISIPLERSIPTQPITKLEVIAMIKTILSGRVLAVKKQSTYTNPDCHHVKFLEDRGEFQMIKVGCYVENIVQAQE